MCSRLVRLIGEVVDMDINGSIGQRDYCGAEGDVAFFMLEITMLQDPCDCVFVVDLRFDLY